MRSHSLPAREADRGVPRPAALLRMEPVPPATAMTVVECRAGRIVVSHPDGYVFTFQIHDIRDLAMDLEAVTWSSVGAPPDADDLELQARAVAEKEAKSYGWLA